MSRYLRALAVAYTLIISLLAARWWLQAWSYRHLHASLARGGRRPLVPPTLESLHLDFGVPYQTSLEHLAVRLSDLGARPFLGFGLFIAIACLVVTFLAGKSSPDDPVRSARPLRWARYGTVLSLACGAMTFALTWFFWRIRVLHPNPWPTVLLFATMLGATVVALGCGAWRLVRSPGRLQAAAWMLTAPLPIVLWGGIGLYAWLQWDQRLVPNNLPMNLAKMAASSLFRLEASIEYPHRLETDRLVIYYDRLEDPHRDAEAMDKHLAGLEGLLGGPLRSKVYWVRGELHWIGIGRLSVHGIALGSGDSTTDWESAGTLDRHELAHAAIDQFSRVGTDSPFLLHEGWAEAQSGVGSMTLARRASEQRSANPSLGVRDMVGAEWYHQDAGPVYLLGGAFVDFLIRRDGVGKFLRLYNESREDHFGAVVQEVYGTALDTLEAEFWEDVRRRMDETPVAPKPTKNPPG